MILQLRGEGKTLAQIAQRFDRAVSSIHEVIDRYEPTTALAIARARNRALTLTDATFDGLELSVKDGKNLEHALELIDRLGVAEKRQVEGGKGSHVNIVIGMPGQPVGPDPLVVNLSPSDSPHFHSVNDDESLVRA